ncbi:MAG: hypothetical protein ABJE95_39025 [Byssovorax sp.]
MADTILLPPDDEPPPTLDEPPVLTEAEAAALDDAADEIEAPRRTVVDPIPAAPRPPMPRSWKIAVALSILAAILLVAGVAFYLFVVRYEPLARRHIPGNANLVARFDVADLALFGPVREHLVPLMFDPAPGDAPKGKTRADRVRAATGVNLATDLRELYVASVEGASFVAILGGKIARGRVVSGLAAVAKEEAWPGGWRVEGELLRGPDGITIAQADDGTVLLGTSEAIVVAALPASDDFARLALPEKGASSFAVTREAWSGAAGAAVVAHASVLRKIERASGTFTLGKTPEITMQIEPSEANPAPALAGEIEQLLAEMRIVALLLPDTVGEKGALQAARVSAKDGHVIVTAPWSYEALDHGCARLAGMIKVSLSASPESLPHH